MTYLTIYGEEITGKIVSRLLNTVVVVDEGGNTHLVHNTDIGEEAYGKHGVTMRRENIGGFNLESCQRIGRTGYAVRKAGW